MYDSLMNALPDSLKAMLDSSAFARPANVDPITVQEALPDNPPTLERQRTTRIQEGILKKEAVLNEKNREEEETEGQP